MALSKQDVDARVQAAVENLQAGRGVEDDAGLEFKGEWPDPADKARQLAGAANALRGDPLVLVIGVHNATGEVTVPTKTEPQEWYAQFRKRFDQIAPELLWVQTVFVGEPPASVLVLVFGTDEFPYVINAPNRREVPLRVGTGTESAHRNQLVRMFDPSLRVPAMFVTVASLRAEWEDRPVVGGSMDSQEAARVLSLNLSLHARVLIEHSGTQPATLPVRDMRARIVCSDFETRPEVRVKHLGGDSFRPGIIRSGEQFPPEPIPPQHGVYARDQHVVAISPGEFTITARDYIGSQRTAPNAEMSDFFDFFNAEDKMRLDLSMRIVGVERQVKLSAPLLRSETFRETRRPGPSGEHISATLGVWEMPTLDSDPWG